MLKHMTTMSSHFLACRWTLPSGEMYITKFDIAWNMPLLVWIVMLSPGTRKLDMVNRVALSLSVSSVDWSYHPDMSVIHVLCPSSPAPHATSIPSLFALCSEICNFATFS